MTISLRLSKEETAVIRSYAEMKKLTVSEVIRQTMLERIEDEYDLEAFRIAFGEYEKDPKTYSLDEAEKELGLK